MKNATWSALAATPIDELRRRIAIVGDLTDVAVRTVDGVTRFAWDDGGGQFTIWYFAQDGRVLLLIFDHETALNLSTEKNYARQASLYHGVPDDLVRLVHNRPIHEGLHVRDGETGETIHSASGVFWFDGERWRPSEGLLAHCDREDLDLWRESGFDYCLGPYLLGRAFTPEAIVEHREDEGWYADDAESHDDLLMIRETFSRHA